MYHHPTTQANVQTLKERGVFFAGPAAGRMASGLSGEGRMVESGELFGWVRVMLGRERGLKGRYVVVTAGPTQEPIDPVRYITNRSSGKQGVALAQAALDAGAKVTLIMGPSAEPTPTGTEVIHVESSQQMHDATVQTIAQADVLLMAAAVADFRPANFATQKIKKTEAEAWGLAIGLERTLDILSEVKKHREATGFPHLVLGFAAETQNAFNYGRDKMQRKGLDFIAINDVTADGAGFQVPTNRITLLNKDGELLKLPLMSKAEVAEQIIRHIVQALH
jgi:phosphopantothenoylcysteine decarboxylase/phosphopantothenate--cysteine ligase